MVAVVDTWEWDVIPYLLNLVEQPIKDLFLFHFITNLVDFLEEQNY